MGLDMYLRAKTNKLPYEGGTGCCSGMFPIAPKDNGMVELGYWRKAYDQQEVIMEFSEFHGGEDNCVDMRILPEGIDKIIETAKEILETHTFNDEGEDEDSGYYTTWQSKQKWEDTIEFFTKAKELLKEDPTAEIYYCQWY